jgi:hypothetical protein
MIEFGATLQPLLHHLIAQDSFTSRLSMASLLMPPGDVQALARALIGLCHGRV